MNIRNIVKNNHFQEICWVTGACAIAAALRIWLPWDHIFSGGHINFSGNDSYYQMNIIRQLYEGIPAPGVATFYAQGIIGIAWLASLGHLSWNVIVQIALYIPVVLAVVTVIIVYFIGRLLHSHFTGCVAAFIVAVLPGEYFYRSWLGAVDYHALEVFLTSGIILCLIMWAKRDIHSNIASWAALGSAAFLAYFYYSLWQGAIGFMPVFAAFICLPLYKYFKNNKTTRISTITIVTILALYLSFLIFGKTFGISNQTTSWTAEAQPGIFDYLITMHIFIALIIAIVYYRQNGRLRLAVVIWTILLVIAAAWQKRFDYYLIIPLSILLGFALDVFYHSILGWGKEPLLEEKIIPLPTNEEI